MRTTVNLPAPLLENAKQRAEQRGITLSVLLEEALLRMFAGGAPKPAPKPFKLRTFKGTGLVDPNLDITKTAEILAREEDEWYRERTNDGHA